MATMDATRQKYMEVMARICNMARTNMAAFVEANYKNYDWNWHHELTCGKLNAFAEGHIKKLIIAMPPQHGKSELSSRQFLPCHHIPCLCRNHLWVGPV